MKVHPWLLQTSSILIFLFLIKDQIIVAQEVPVFRNESGFRTEIFSEIFTGYEHLDQSDSTQNQNDQDSGFRVDTLALEIISERLGPSLKGLTLGLSLELVSARTLGQPCDRTQDCRVSNDYSIILSQAYAQFPIASNYSITIGQQNSPIAKSFTDFWFDYHVQDNIFLRVNATPEYWRGLNFHYNDKLGAIDLLLGNGEGSQFVNSDPSAPLPSSEALSLQGLFTITPPLENNDFTRFTLLFPFQWDNALIFRRQTPQDTKNFDQIRSYAWGWSTDLSIDDGINRWSAQIGSYYLHRPPYNGQPKANGRFDFFQTSYKYGIIALLYRYFESSALSASNGNVEYIPDGTTGGKTTGNLWGLNFYIKAPWEFFTITLGTESITATHQDPMDSTILISSRTHEVFLRLAMRFSLVVF